MSEPDGQDRPAGDEHALGAEEVGESASQQEQTAEGDHVGVEHPREVVLVKAQVLLDVGQGDADDRRVHDDHELGQRDDRESPTSASDWLP